MTLTLRPAGRRIALVAVGVLAAATLTTVTATEARAAVACGVNYSTSDWTEAPGRGGFTANLILTNTGDPLSGWTLTFSFTAGQRITQGWSANWTQPAGSSQVTATPLDWNRNLATGASTTIGFNATWTGSNPAPPSFSVNGVVCGGGQPPQNSPPTVSLTSPAPNATFTAPASVPLAATAADPDGSITRVEFLLDNVLVGTDTTAPYSFTATGVAAGAHSAQARAFDNGSPALSANSQSVPFTVSGTTTPAITATPTSLTVAEGGSSTVVFRLNAAPAAGVTVSLARTGDTSITMTPTSFTLTGTTWNTGQSVTVSAAEDTDTTNGTASITATATGHTGATVAVTEADNDVPAGTHVENPFSGATGYVNPDWSAQVLQEATATGGTLGAAMQRVSGVSTAVWMDRIGAITEGRGLRGHLNAALSQDQANGAAPLTFPLVVYDLPNRDCAALASNGELLISQNGLARYKAEYIDPIAAILADPAYANLRIVAYVEPDSIPNLVTNLSTPACAEANSSGAYVEGIRYAISKLRPMPNVYLYLDVAHSGWLGWSSNFGPAVDRYIQLLQSPGPGLNSVDGFVSNTANYTPVEEPFLPNPNLTVGGQQVMSATFYEFNPMFDEIDFATALRNAFVSRGMPSGTGMLIDTSRNGWGGTARPTGVSTSTDLNTYVNASRIDRRPHRGGWCNQAGAGIGFRPAASPAAGIDAYVWVKPPGESDGVSSAGVPDPTDPNKKFDAMCDPNAQNRYNSAFPTNALPGAPHAGRWFPDQFRMLVQNAFPAL